MSKSLSIPRYFTSGPRRCERRKDAQAIIPNLETPKATLITNIEPKRRESWMGKYLPWKSSLQSEQLGNARKMLVAMLQRQQEENNAELAMQLEQAARAARLATAWAKAPEPVFDMPTIAKPPTMADELVKSLKTSSNRIDFVQALQKCAQLGDWQTADRVMRLVRGAADEEILILLAQSYVNGNNLLQALRLVEKHISKPKLPLGLFEVVLKAVPNNESPYSPNSLAFLSIMQQLSPKSSWLRFQTFYMQACYKYLWIVRQCILHPYVSFVRNDPWISKFDEDTARKRVQDTFQWLTAMPKEDKPLSLSVSRVAAYAIYLAQKLNLEKTKEHEECFATMHRMIQRKGKPDLTLELAIAMNELADVSLMEYYDHYFSQKLAHLNKDQADRDLYILMISCSLHLQLTYTLKLDWEKALNNAIAVLEKMPSITSKPVGPFVSMMVMSPQLPAEVRVMIVTRIFTKPVPFNFLIFTDLYDQILPSLPMDIQQTLTSALRNRGLHVFNKPLFQTWIQSDDVDQIMTLLEGKGARRLDIWELALSMHPSPKLTDRILSSASFPTIVATKQTWQLASHCLTSLEQLDMMCKLIDDAGQEREVLINAATLANILEVIITFGVIPKKDTDRVVQWLATSKSFNIDGSTSREASLMSMLNE